MISGSQVTVRASRPSIVVDPDNASDVFLANPASAAIELGGPALAFGSGFAYASGSLELGLYAGDTLYGQLDPDTSLVDADAVVTEDDSGATFADETTDAGEGTANDVTLPDPFDENDALYIGADALFAGVDINVGTVGVGDAVDDELAYEYWNGAAWTALGDVTDGTEGLTVTATNRLAFTVPDDWTANTVNSQGPYFYIRIRATADDVWNTTQPIITQLWVLDDETGTATLELLVVDSHGRGQV